MKISSFMKKAINKYMAAGITKEGACALAANQYHESDGFVANRVDYLCLQRLRENGKVYTHESYTKAIDNGEMSCEQFLHPLPGKQYGYGISQWTSPGRKAGLLQMTKCKGKSIADEDAQIEFTIKELKEAFVSLYEYLKKTKDIDGACDRVLKDYESPNNIDMLKAGRRQTAREILAAMQTTKTGVTAAQVISVMKSWIGLDRANGSHKPIIDLYNSHKPLARGYAVTMKDAYCDVTVSAAFIKLGAVDMIGGTECGVEEHIQNFKKKGIWEEDGTVKPKPGWIICYNWDDDTQPNDGWADHIGVVEKVEGKTITCIEGNIGGKVGRRTIAVGNGYIRGYAVPDYK